MDIHILEDLGLTGAEIKVYLALLELGSSTAGPLLEKSGLQNSVVHRALLTLIDKSLINYILEGKRRVYQATDPENFHNYMDSKRERFDEILPELKRRQQLSQQKETATVYRGTRGVREVYNIMINTEAKEYLTFGGGQITLEVMGRSFWMNIHRRRIEKKLPSRQVFDLTVQPVGGNEIEKMPMTNIRYLPARFAQFQETVIVGDKVAITVFSEKPYALLIHDKKVADGYRKHFEIMWDVAKK